MPLAARPASQLRSRLAALLFSASRPKFARPPTIGTFSLGEFQGVASLLYLDGSTHRRNVAGGTSDEDVGVQERGARALQLAGSQAPPVRRGRPELDRDQGPADAAKR